MALTRDYKNTIRERADKDSDFAAALKKEFERSARAVLEKNEELYRRLS